MGQLQQTDGFHRCIRYIETGKKPHGFGKFVCVMTEAPNDQCMLLRCPYVEEMRSRQQSLLGTNAPEKTGQGEQ